MIGFNYFIQGFCGLAGYFVCSLDVRIRKVYAKIRYEKIQRDLQPFNRSKIFFRHDYFFPFTMEIMEINHNLELTSLTSVCIYFILDSLGRISPNY